MVVFGGSILAGGDVLAKAINDGIAKTYIIVGGIGHTTESLRQIAHRVYPNIETRDFRKQRFFRDIFEMYTNVKPITWKHNLPTVEITLHTF